MSQNKGAQGVKNDFYEESLSLCYERYTFNHFQPEHEPTGSNSASP